MQGVSVTLGRRFNTVKDPTLIYRRLMPMDYFIGFPIATAASITFIGTLQSLSLEKIKNKVEDEFVKVYLPLCIVQITVFAFNYLVMPPGLWFAVQTITNPFWFAYFSHKSNKSIES